MGANQTKVDGQYLPDTPTLQAIYKRSNRLGQELQLTPLRVDPNLNAQYDPRSPNPAVRTPIRHVLRDVNPTNEIEQQNSYNAGIKPLHSLRRRILKTFSYNINDPRSPSINRTPLAFENQNDKTLNLDDTFADLFVDPHTTEGTYEGCELKSSIKGADGPLKGSSDMDIDIKIEEESVDVTKNATSGVTESFTIEEGTVACSAGLQVPTLSAAQQKIDPRSPTIGLDRTPIIFTDDDEAGENMMLETILATLSLNIGNSSSGPSNERTNSISLKRDTNSKLTNKQLNRIRNGKQKRLNQKKITHTRYHHVYEDSENITPKKSHGLSHVSESGSKRTPLSCVKNRTHLRSKSVECITKSTKEHVVITSLDDNPIVFNYEV